MARTSLLDDRQLDFLLYEVLDVPALCRFSYFSDHSKETFDLFLGASRRLAREQLFPAYKPMDDMGGELEDGAVKVHPVMKELWPRFVELGVLAGMRSYDVGGQQLPFSVMSAALAYLYGANLGAAGFAGLSLSAAHLIEAFGDDELRAAFMTKMYAGEWTGTMALTEPNAGSSLGDLRTTAVPHDDGSYRIKGTKIFISGGDQDFSENIVHLTLARIEGAPAGTKGISLFAVPKLRTAASGLEDNDVTTSGIVHKLGWRGLPSVMLSFGEKDDCRGWLVGQAHQGLRYMFQMMNEARIGVGLTAAATASAGYLTSLQYARERTQGRKIGQGTNGAPVPILEHADVRRMLLRQKAIVEGSLHLVLQTARYADVAAHGDDEGERERAQQLLDLLTPLTKTFPAERGFEANALAVQVHGGYGYATEYLPEAWLRDQKLNTLHEGTTGIQSLDLLGRKVMRGGGAPLMLLADEIQKEISAAREAGVEAGFCDALTAALERVGAVTMALGQRGMTDPEAMLQDSVDYLDMLSVLVVGWLWLKQAAVAAVAAPSAGASDAAFYEGKRRAAQYWYAHEMPRVALLAAGIEAADNAFATMKDEQF